MGDYTDLPDDVKRQILIGIVYGNNFGFDRGDEVNIISDFIFRLGNLTGITFSCELETVEECKQNSSKYRGITKEVKEKIKQLYGEGMTKSAIAKELGINRKTVIKYTSE